MRSEASQVAEETANGEGVTQVTMAKVLMAGRAKTVEGGAAKVGRVLAFVAKVVEEVMAQEIAVEEVEEVEEVLVVVEEDAKALDSEVAMGMEVEMEVAQKAVIWVRVGRAMAVLTAARLGEEKEGEEMAPHMPQPEALVPTILAQEVTELG